ncbi:MAG: hypothetical protein IJZ82_05630 [Lachnospiraceae bacterium]|nr:hypothetical protein [Lachnospiraceae bacterium]
MIHEMKRAFKLLPYAYNFKANLFLGGTFVLGGFILVMLTGGDMVWGRYGGLLAMAGGFFPSQMIFSLGVSEEVLVSPLRKTLFTKAIAMLNWLMFAGIYLISALIRGIQCGGNPMLLSMACRELVLMAVFGTIIMVYGAMALKYFWLPTIMFCSIYPMVNMFWGDVSIKLESGIVSYGLMAAAGFVILLIGAVLGYGISLLIYRKPISKMSQNASLRQYM